MTANSSHDALLNCLLSIANFYQRTCSVDSLIAGLPLVENQLTPELCIRAAQRLHCNATLIQISLANLQNYQCPAILLLKENQACVLVEKTKKHAKIIQSQFIESYHEIALAKLAETYTGEAILIQANLIIDERDNLQTDKPVKHWFWNTIAQYWGIYFEIIIASLLINSFALTSSLFVMNVYDRVVPNHAFETLWVLAIGALIVFSFDFLMRLLRGYFIDKTGKSADKQLSNLVFEQLLAIQRNAFPHSAGAFANHLQDFESFREFFTSITLTSLMDLPFILLFLSVIYFIHPSLTLLPLCAIILILSFSLLVQFPLRSVIAKSMQVSAQKQGMLIEVLNSMETIKIQRAEGILQRKWELLLEEIHQHSLSARFWSALSFNGALFIQQIAYVLMVVQGVYLIAENELSLGGLIASTLLMGRTIAPLTQIASLLTRFHQARSALTAMNKIMQLPNERTQTALQRPHLTGTLEFRQVNFSYPTSFSNSPLALKNVSFKIQAGEKVGIIGRMGSGKTSLAKLILRLYTAQQGNVLLEGVDIQQIDPADVRRNIAYVAQDSALFYGTLRENIVFGHPFATDAEILAVVKLAGIDSFTTLHPLGLNLMIGERGEGLSSGQRQAVILARALLANPPILLLDEPTNGMDNSSEEAFKQQLQPLLADKTLLLITHRTSLLTLVDKLIVLDNGVVVAMGEKNQVIQALAQGQIRQGS